MMKQVNIQIPLRMLGLLLGLFLSVGAFAQITVKGHVKDAQGEPIIGATIRVAGTQTATVSDFDGNFTLKANQGATLNVSYIGYQPATAKAAANVVVTLQDDQTTLNDIVVIGYGVARKNDLTGSVTAIKPDDKNHGVITNAQDMIQGKIAGVNVTNYGGEPGAGAAIRIRGGSSLNASNDPLIVIDGMEMDGKQISGMGNPLNLVNPADIESFTVLKDASATAIYGSRGSNGVIIITTKKGRKNQKPQVSYNGNVSYSTRANSLDVLDAAAYRDFIKSYYGEDSKAASLLGDADTDWQDEIYTGAFSVDHNVTVSGGIKNLPYRFSAGYTYQDGILKTSNYQRTTVSTTLNPSFLDDHLKFNINGKFMSSYKRNAASEAIGEAVRMDPTQPVHANGFENFNSYFTWTKVGTTLKDANYPLMTERNSAKNPMALLTGYNDRGNSVDYLGNVEVDYQVNGFEDLRLHMNFSGDWANGKQKLNIPIWAQGDNFYYGRDGYSKENKYNLAYTAYAQYYKDFLKTQHFDIMGGYEWSHFKYWGDNYYAGKYQATTTDADDDGNSLAGKPYQVSQSVWKQENYLVSFYGRANYIAFDRYMLTATVRRDGSSRFDEHWATFPAFALGWKINEEAFLKNAKWLSELKLRLGWGKTGQQDIGQNYAYFASYNVNTTSTDGRYPIKGVNDEGLLYRPDAYNKELKWETTTTSNIGLDFAFFKNRISGSVDYYYRETTDLLNQASVSAGTNFRNQVWTNIGTLENKGVEASLTVRPVMNDTWQWEVTGNFTYNQNKITELTGESAIVPAGNSISSGTGNQVQAHTVGRPANSFYVYQQVYDAEGKPLEGVYVDRNGDGQYSEEDMYFYKSPNAPYTAGLSSRLQYKSWDLGFSLRASFDNYVFWDKEASYVNVAKRFDSSYDYLQNSMPGAIRNGWTNYDKVITDYFVHNASFLKCDNITLGYSFKTFDDYLNGRAYISATNVFTITKYKGLDPEVSGGIDNNMYPRPFTIQMGVNLNF